MDSGTNELFTSHGRRKRSVRTQEDEVRETLSAVIRVLARGEEDEMWNSNHTDGFYQ